MVCLWMTKARFIQIDRSLVSAQLNWFRTIKPNRLCVFYFKLKPNSRQLKKNDKVAQKGARAGKSLQWWRMWWNRTSKANVLLLCCCSVVAYHWSWSKKEKKQGEMWLREDNRLIVLFESDVMRVITETTTADVKSILADQTMMILAHTADGKRKEQTKMYSKCFELSSCILTRCLFWYKSLTILVNQHQICAGAKTIRRYFLPCWWTNRWRWWRQKTRGQAVNQDERKSSRSEKRSGKRKRLMVGRLSNSKWRVRVPNTKRKQK